MTNETASAGADRFNQSINFTDAAHHDFLINAVGSMLIQPGAIQCFKKPLDCITNHSADFAGNRIYDFFSYISSLGIIKDTAAIADLIIKSIGASYETPLDLDLRAQTDILLKPVQQAARVTFDGESLLKINPPATFNLLNLLGPTYIYYLATKKVKESVALFFECQLSGNWEREIKLTNLAGCSSSEGCQVTGSFTKIYTRKELGLSSMFWGGIAYLTQRGIRNAITESNDSVTADQALTVLTTAIALIHILQIPMASLWKRLSASSSQISSTRSPSVPIGDKPYHYIESKKDEVDMEDEVLKLAAQRAEIKKKLTFDTPAEDDLTSRLGG